MRRKNCHESAQLKGGYRLKTAKNYGEITVRHLLSRYDGDNEEGGENGDEEDSDDGVDSVEPPKLDKYYISNFLDFLPK